TRLSLGAGRQSFRALCAGVLGAFGPLVPLVLVRSLGGLARAAGRGRACPLFVVRRIHRAWALLVGTCVVVAFQDSGLRERRGSRLGGESPAVGRLLGLAVVTRAGRGRPPSLELSFALSTAALFAPAPAPPPAPPSPVARRRPVLVAAAAALGRFLGLRRLGRPLLGGDLGVAQETEHARLHPHERVPRRLLDGRRQLRLHGDLGRAA